jgi:tetratricopeptide (TPR) repeat protein
MKSNSILISILIILIGCKNSKEKEDQKLYSSGIMCAPKTTDREWYNADNIAPLFQGLGNLNFPITTDKQLVQKYFNQGLVLAYGFNHAEAARSFYYASKLDPNCAMAYWGYAYVLGPNYNAGMENDNYQRAYSAIQKALKIGNDETTEQERDLILALSKRYVKNPIEDRHHLDIDYSNAMENVFKKYPNNADIGVLYVESLMNLHPWDLFDKSGKPNDWTPNIISTLESIIEKNPNHCGANHFYIHAVESSDKPEKGLESAKRFDEGLVPNAGHLVHMPSHIYIRTGDYHKGTLANINAIKVDSAYVSSCHAQGAYPLAYFPHNQHFMAATATLEGNSKWALYAADEVAKNSSVMLMKEPGWGTIQHYYTIPYYVYVKFGKWDEILRMKNNVPDLGYPTAIWHYARGMAFLGKKNIEDAKKELKLLKIISSNNELKDVTIWDINSVYELVQIAEKVLNAEIKSSEGNFSKSIVLLKEAISIEDNLNYNEPPDWFFSVRHNLGAIQLQSGLNEEAIKTYLDDLIRLPKNGWALKGLENAYFNLNDMSNLKESKQKFIKAWENSDITLSSSVIK